MERRYLAATIALAATFAVFSHAFSSGLLTRVHDPRTTLISGVHCAAQTLRARLLDKVNRSLGSGNAEEAQLRVELNLPLLAAPAAHALPPAAPVAPVAPVPPVTAAASGIACPSQPVVAAAHLPRDVARLPRDYNRAQIIAMKMQSKALAKQARLMAVQARLTSNAMQREITRAALVEARAGIAQAKSSSHPCSGRHTGQRIVHVSTGSDADDVNVDVDMDQLSQQIQDQVKRSLRTSVPNF